MDWQAIKAQAQGGFEAMLRQAGLPVNAGLSRPASFTAAAAPLQQPFGGALPPWAAPGPWNWAAPPAAGAFLPPQQHSHAPHQVLLEVPWQPQPQPQQLQAPWQRQPLVDASWQPPPQQVHWPPPLPAEAQGKGLGQRLTSPPPSLPTSPPASKSAADPAGSSNDGLPGSGGDQLVAVALERMASGSLQTHPEALLSSSPPAAVAAAAQQALAASMRSLGSAALDALVAAAEEGDVPRCESDAAEVCPMPPPAAGNPAGPPSCQPPLVHLPRQQPTEQQEQPPAMAPGITAIPAVPAVEMEASAAAAAALARFEQLQAQLQQLQVGLPTAGPPAPSVEAMEGCPSAVILPGAGPAVVPTASPVMAVMHQAESFLAQAQALLQRLQAAAASPLPPPAQSACCAPPPEVQQSLPLQPLVLQASPPAAQACSPARATGTVSSPKAGVPMLQEWQAPAWREPPTSPDATLHWRSAPPPLPVQQQQQPLAWQLPPSALPPPAEHWQQDASAVWTEPEASYPALQAETSAAPPHSAWHVQPQQPSALAWPQQWPSLGQQQLGRPAARSPAGYAQLHAAVAAAGAGTSRPRSAWQQQAQQPGGHVQAARLAKVRLARACVHLQPLVVQGAALSSPSSFPPAGARCTRRRRA